MGKQRIHPNLGELDICTATELNDVMGHQLDVANREKARTVKLMKFPQIRVIATGTSFIMGSSSSQPAPVGPEQGFLWRIGRILVASNVSADAAKYVLYTGSDPTLTDSGHILEGFSQGQAGQGVGIGYYPNNYGAWLFGGEQIYAAVTGATIGNQYVMSGIGVEVAQEMVYKLVGG
jgi:hypothetical protein